jgi:hypothetical protein
MMKKVFFTVLAFIALGTTAVNAKNEKKLAVKIPAGFANDFTGAENVQWTNDPDFYYARFTQDGTNIVAVYEKETGNYIGHLKTTDADHLPSAVRQILARDFAGFKAIGSVVEIINPDRESFILTIENEKQILKIKTEINGFTTVLSRIKKV